VEDSAHSVQLAGEMTEQIAVGVTPQYRASQPCWMRWCLGRKDMCARTAMRWLVAETVDHTVSSASERGP
jgi:hypothetical protein